MADIKERHALWAIITDEHQRDGYALRPMPWDGPGEYQHVTFADGQKGFVSVGHGEGKGGKEGGRGRG